ncbi:MAG: glycosyltransferase family 39 protein [bacterium]
MAVLLTGIILRFYRLGEPLWLDEVLTVNSALKPLYDIPKDLIHGPAGSTPPLFYILLHFWIRIFGQSDAGMHFFTACIGIAGIAAIWRTGTLLAGRLAGLAGAAVMAAHPFHIAASQEVRPYGLLVFFSALSFYFLLEALRDNRSRHWVLYSAISTANLFTHNYAVFLLIVQFLLALDKLVYEGGRFYEKVFFAFAAIFAAYLAWVPGLLMQTRKHAIFSYLSPPGFHEIKLTLYALAGLWTTSGASSSQWPFEMADPLLAAYFLAGGYAAYHVSGRNRRLAWNLSCSACATILIPFVISLKTPIYHPGRHAIIILPFVCLFWGLAAESVKSIRWRTLILLLCFVSGLGTAMRYFSIPKSYDRAIAAYLKSTAKPGYQIVIPQDYRKIPIAYYYPEASAAATAIPRTSAGKMPEGIITVEIRGGNLDEDQQDILKNRYYLAEQKLFGNFAVANLFLAKGGQNSRNSCVSCGTDAKNAL